MNKLLMIAIAGAVLTSVLSSTAASAATICVHPAGAGGCATTIQGAVDLAVAGDVVQIAPGIYYENVVVRTDQDGLRIVGAANGSSILDGSPYFDRGIAGGDRALLVLAPNVQVQNLSFRNGLIGIHVLFPGAILEGLRSRGTDNPVIIEAPNVTVRGSDFRACFACVLVYSTDAVVSGNTLASAFLGIHAERTTRPDRPQIVGNRVEGALQAIGATTILEPLVRSNRVRYSRDGIDVWGPNPVVENNVVSGGVGGIYTFCTGINLEAGPADDVPAECSRASYQFNTVIGSHVQGAIVGAEAPGMVARGNTVVDTAGFSIGGTPGEIVPILVERNRVVNAGSCFTVGSSGGHVRGNTAVGCAGSGFYVDGLENRLEANQALGTAENGFTVNGFVPPEGGSTAMNNVLEGNVARANAAQGIAILSGAYFTTVTGNTATGNRTDFCDEGLGTSASDNAFGTVGPCAVLH